MGIPSCRPPVARPPLSNDPEIREIQLRERAISALRNDTPRRQPDSSSILGNWVGPFLFGWMMGHD